ncbi:hemicentin-2-like [Sitodiplosis mosellana]|uniref:hemicentin-2-like n=1 Tax=Sitodiplosis mosellana TaxID=263140 RepID=UPI0024445E3A|nr:hemicentin-2-like [Sitodiplosis mosellana]
MEVAVLFLCFGVILCGPTTPELWDESTTITIEDQKSTPTEAIAHLSSIESTESSKSYPVTIADCGQCVFAVNDICISNCTETTTELKIETNELDRSDESSSPEPSEPSPISTTEDISSSTLSQLCEEDEFKCSTGGCISRRWICDEDEDCAEGDDELNCLENQCRDDEFKCSTGKCIPRGWICDYGEDCPDGEDELNCTPETTTEWIKPTEPNSSDDFESETEIYKSNEEIDSDEETAFESDSELAHVVYNTPQPLRVRLSNQYTVEQNTDFTLPCKAVGKKFVKAIWQKMYDKNLGPNVQQIGNVLKISNAQPINHGIYQCTIEENCQNATATTFIAIEPRKVPVIKIYPSESQVVDVGQQVMLDCRVMAGFPKPNVQWIRRDLKPLSYRIEQQMPWRPAGLMIIRDITVEEAGEYECQASNIAGKVSEMISIIVQEQRPVISIWPNVQQMDVVEGTQLALYCSVNASTPLDVKWYGPNTISSRNEYVPNGIVHYKHNVSRSDEGIYVCRAGNKSGTQKKHIKVSVQPKLVMSNTP